MILIIKKDIKSMTFKTLENEILNNNQVFSQEKSFRIKQIFNWVHKFGVHDFELMNNLPKELREQMKVYFYFNEIKTEKMLVSKIDKTTKFLFKLLDDKGNADFIESVVMKYEYGNTICISTQVGCNMGCKFCASTLLGKKRDLSAAEMLLQIEKAENELGIKISNVVLMGIGEPFDNFDNVLNFLYIINDKNGRGMSQRHITISTCGIVPKIKILADKNLQLTLTVSLHASSDEVRSALMPINKKYDLKSLIEACDYYFKKTHRRISFEFALIENINDSIEEAENLVNLLKKLPKNGCHVNLIPVNNVKETGFKKSTDIKILKFQNILIKNDLNCTIRRTLGADINAACGQLRRDTLFE